VKSCPHCKALYEPAKRIYGYYKGTSAQFVKLGNISEKQCPVCRRENSDGEGKPERSENG